MIQPRFVKTEPTYEQFRTALRYLGVTASMHPHINVDGDGNHGLPDSEDVYCLACTIMETVQIMELDIPVGDDGDVDPVYAAAAMDAWSTTCDEIFKDE